MGCVCMKCVCVYEVCACECECVCARACVSVCVCASVCALTHIKLDVVENLVVVLVPTQDFTLCIWVVCMKCVCV